MSSESKTLSPLTMSSESKTGDADVGKVSLEVEGRSSVGPAAPKSDPCYSWAFWSIMVLCVLTIVGYVAGGGLSIAHARDCGLSVDASLKSKVCVEMPQIQTSAGRRRQLRSLSSGVKSMNNTVEFRCKPGSESTCSTAPGGDCTPEKLYILGAFMISDEKQGRDKKWVFAAAHVSLPPGMLTSIRT